MKPKLTLTNPTDDELSAAVAEHVAGWKRIPAHGTWREMWENSKGSLELDGHWFAWFADAVLPLLNRYARVDIIKCGTDDSWNVAIFDGHHVVGEAKSNLARAICIALLRANGIEVIFT